MCAGDIDVFNGRMNSELAKHKANSFGKAVQQTEPFKMGETVHIDCDTPQTIVWFAHPVCQGNSKDIFGGHNSKYGSWQRDEP